MKYEKGQLYGIFICPKCGKKIISKIVYDEYPLKKDDLDLHICSCVSGGIYSIYVNCPKCGEQIDIY